MYSQLTCKPKSSCMNNLWLLTIMHARRKSEEHAGDNLGMKFINTQRASRQLFMIAQYSAV